MRSPGRNNVVSGLIDFVFLPVYIGGNIVVFVKIEEGTIQKKVMMMTFYMIYSQYFVFWYGVDLLPVKKLNHM